MNCSLCVSFLELFLVSVVSSYALEYLHLRMPGALRVLAHARTVGSGISTQYPRAVRYKMGRGEEDPDQVGISIILSFV